MEFRNLYDDNYYVCEIWNAIVYVRLIRLVYVDKVFTTASYFNIMKDTEALPQGDRKENYIVN